MPSTYEKLREIIIAANPDILKLEFGCQVEIIDNIKTKKYFHILRRIKNEYVLYNSRHDAAFVKKSNKLKILGRPIRLADILIAIKKKMFSTEDKSTREMINDYNLSFDNLENQSQEFLDKLLEILS